MINILIKKLNFLSINLHHIKLNTSFIDIFEYKKVKKNNVLPV